MLSPDRSLLGCWALFMYRRFFRIWPALMVSVLVVTMCASVWSGDGVFSACGTGQFWSVIWRNGLFVWNLKAWGEEVRRAHRGGARGGEPVRRICRPPPSHSLTPRSRAAR